TVGTLPVLSSVTAPQGPNGPRIVSIAPDNAEANRVSTIADPDQSAVSFFYDADEQIKSRVDPMSHVVHFGYDPASHLLVGATVDLANEPALASAFCPAQATSLAECASGVVDTSAVRTKFTSPRRDVPDTTAFYLTRHGAPRKIVDGIGRTT